MANYESELAVIHRAYVVRDKVNTWRWYDAFGPGVVKYILNPTALPVDDTTHDPTEFTNTIVEAGAGGDSTVTVTDVAGGAILITTDNAENDGYKMQLGHGAGGAGENVSFAANYPTYFGITFQMSDATQSDILAGFCITDTTCLDGTTDGLYFRKVDAATSVYIVLEKNSAESATAVATAANATDLHLEFLVNDGYVYAYADDALMATIATTDAGFPNDELLRLTLEFLTGAAAAITCTVKELRFIQIQQ